MKQSRRKFIENAVLATVGILVFNNCKSSPFESKKKIIVIGAGIAGLTAANKLSGEGYEVVVLEADNKIGGRIQSVDFGGMKADLGASWIHGTKNNPLYNFAQNNNVETISTKEEPSYIFDISGEDVTLEEWNKWEKFLNKLVNESFNYPNISLEKLIEKFWSDEILSPKLERVFHAGIRLELEIPYAEDSNKLAANVLHNDGYYPGKHVILPKGMSGIIDILALNLDIKFNTYVSKIDYEDNDIIVHTIESNDVPSLRSCNACHSNSTAEELSSTGTYKADRVLVALPISILKNKAVTFNPELPIDKNNAIQNIQMGTMNKVYIRFEEAFWPEDGRFFSKTTENPSEMFELMNMNIINQKPILIAFFGGSHAKHIELLNENSLSNYISKQLKDIFGQDIPEPVEIIKTQWHQNKYSLGSYPVIPPGFTNKLFTEIAKPINNKVFFAGDATEKIHYASAHGAYKSGIRAANEIINSL